MMVSSVEYSVILLHCTLLFLLLLLVLQFLLSFILFITFSSILSFFFVILIILLIWPFLINFLLLFFNSVSLPPLLSPLLFYICLWLSSSFYLSYLLYHSSISSSFYFFSLSIPLLASFAFHFAVFIPLHTSSSSYSLLPSFSLFINTIHLYFIIIIILIIIIIIITLLFVS